LLDNAPRRFGWLAGSAVTHAASERTIIENFIVSGSSSIAAATLASKPLNKCLDGLSPELGSVTRPLQSSYLWALQSAGANGARHQEPLRGNCILGMQVKRCIWQVTACSTSFRGLIGLCECKRRSSTGLCWVAVK